MLVITRHVGESFYIGDTPVTLSAIGRSCIVLRIDESRLVELAPFEGVMIGMATCYLTKVTRLNARLAFEAPKDVLILRSELRRPRTSNR